MYCSFSCLALPYNPRSAMREDAVTATKTLDNKLYEGRKLALDFAKAKDRPKRKSTNAEAMSGSESEVWWALFNRLSAVA